MNKFTNFKSFNPLLTFILFVAVALMSACGGDDEPDPEPIDCSTLALTATAEGFTITASATGGTAPYQFKLEEGTAQSSTTFTVEESGSYEITVIDANDCEKKTMVQVIDPCANFSVSATASAYDLTITIAEGTAPFRFTVSNGSTLFDDVSSEKSFTFELANAVSTSIKITDANDCEATAEVTADAIATFTDSDNQTYKVVKIGEQIWFAENYNKETAGGSYCYDNDPANCETYGKSYTWDAAKDIAPAGWKLPSEADFEELNNFLGEDAGTKLKVGGETGFEAKLAGGWINSSESFENINEFGYFWTTTEFDLSRNVLFRVSVNTTSFFKSNTSVDNGISVRLLKE